MFGAMKQVKMTNNKHIKCVDKGFKNRNAKWRISYSSQPEVWNPEHDARCHEYIVLNKQNLAHVFYVRGNKKYALSFV